MTQALKLLRHGEHVNPAYAGDDALRADDPQREAGQSGILRHFDKRESASRNPAALGWVKATYTEAIEYTGRTKSLRGLAFVSACFFGPVMVAGGGALASLIFSHTNMPLWAVALDSLFALIGFSGILFGVWLAALAIRVDLFHLSDEPVIFDRKHRKVYRLFMEVPAGRMRVFKPWPVRACAYDWDLIDAEHHLESMVTGATLSSNHRLMFVVRKSADDSTIIDSFQVGNPMDLNEGLTAAMWEHIRRFMETRGPHLPTPDEPLADQSPPPSWWQGLGETGVFGPGYMARWRTQPGTMTLMHLAAPVTVPMLLLWATGNWLSYKTEIKADWPDEVRQAVGMPIDPRTASVNTVNHVVSG